jgi:TDG/mug DNA glycosylase family protein
MTASRDPSTSRLSDGLEPVDGKNPEILVLGSFPSQKSLRHAEYYGNPRNHFWKIVEALYGIDTALPYFARMEQVRENHIALWDVVASCTRPGSADARISRPVFNDIAGFAAARPTLRIIALNGSTAGRFYSRIAEDITVPSIVLPSTSPAYAGMTIAEKIQRWSVILKR